MDKTLSQPRYSACSEKNLKTSTKYLLNGSHEAMRRIGTHAKNTKSTL